MKFCIKYIKFKIIYITIWVCVLKLGVLLAFTFLYLLICLCAGVKGAWGAGGAKTIRNGWFGLCVLIKFVAISLWKNVILIYYKKLYILIYTLTITSVR